MQLPAMSARTASVAARHAAPTSSILAAFAWSSAFQLTLVSSNVTLMRSRVACSTAAQSSAWTTALWYAMQLDGSHDGTVGSTAESSAGGVVADRELPPHAATTRSIEASSVFMPERTCKRGSTRALCGSPSVP